MERLFDDVIGRRALSHLEWDEHFRVHPHTYRWWLYDQAPAHLARARCGWWRSALEDGRHAGLNRRMKALPTVEGDVRLLAGHHDVDAFAASVALSTQWREAVLGFHRFG